MASKGDLPKETTQISNLLLRAEGLVNEAGHEPDPVLQRSIFATARVFIEEALHVLDAERERLKGLD